MNIQVKVSNVLWKPISVLRGGPGLTHLLFADDVLMFCRANSYQVGLVMEMLRDFCAMSGIKITFDRSKAMCSSRVPRHNQLILSHLSSIRMVDDLGVYCGFPLIKGRVNREVYNIVLEKIQMGNLDSF